MRTFGHKILKTDDDSLSRRGENIYYFGTLIFVAGIILIGFASASIMFFQIHYESEAKLITDTVTYMGVGLLCVSLGINFMLRQSKKGYISFLIGSLFAMIAIGMFYFSYETNWYYPTISYILLSYLVGFLLLMGNAFGHVTLWILRKNQETVPNNQHLEPKHTYTDEEIERDIDKAVKQSMQHAADELQFNLNKGPTFKVSAAQNTESIVKRKDAMNESKALQQTLNPGFREEWGGAGVDKASTLLANTLNTESTQKKGFFHFIQNFFTKK
ncbi:MAG: hypothetical protein KGY50_02360 [Candidatus Thermoplasmatota archaeon]|nr:hypothetical protein [Candidatus Thermoplasmatota archaeon]